MPKSSLLNRSPQQPKMERVQYFATLIAALGSGLIAGSFFVFSVAVMRALERVPGGMVAMQSINVVILNPAFLGVFLGTAIVSVVAAILGLVRWEFPRSGYVLAGAVLYVVGSFLVTVVFNVPLNNTLVAADPSSTAGQESWKTYLTDWTIWNHVRTLTSLAALLFFILAATGER